MGNGLSLRLKIILILVAVFAVYAAIDVAVLRLAILPEFEALELREAIDDMERVESVLRREESQLAAFCMDWSFWDDSYAFVADRNSQFIASNITDSTFLDNKLNLIYYLAADGAVAYGAAHLLPSMRPARIDDIGPEGPRGPLRAIFRQRLEQGFSGLWLSGHGPIMLTFQPILTSKKQGPVRGMVVMGRFLNKDMLAALAEQTKVRARFWPLDGVTEKDKLIAGDLAVLRRDGGKLTRRLADGSIEVLSLLAGLDGRPVLLARTVNKRGIIEQGAAAVGYALASTLAAVVIMLALLLVLLNRTVVSPLARLTAHMVDLGQTDDLSKRLRLKRDDELGAMANEFDRLAQRLLEARQSLVEKSYVSGQADMTAGVLHNVGNALAPLVFGLNQSLDGLRAMPLGNMARAAGQLAEDGLEPARRGQLLEYLSLAQDDVRQCVAALEADLQTVLAGVGRLERILKEATDVRRAERPLEPVWLDHLTREAFSMVAPGLQSRFALRLGPGLERVGAIRAHRMPLLQIMGNLLTNAAEAIARGGATGTVTVDADREEHERGPLVRLRVSDDGAGIAADQLDLIFQRGFSGKGAGGSGLGLHWSANAAMSLGGRLYAHSEGPGQGATFHLLLPAGESS